MFNRISRRSLNNVVTKHIFMFIRNSFHKSSNHYKTLGLTPDADPGEIKKKYYQLAHKYHPDKTTGMSKEEIEDLQQ